MSLKQGLGELAQEMPGHGEVTNVDARLSPGFVIVDFDDGYRVECYGDSTMSPDAQEIAFWFAAGLWKAGQWDPGGRPDL